MRISPLDIQQKKFSSKYKGFNAQEVQSFISEIREEMQILSRENAKLRESREKLGEQLKEYENLDRTLKDTISNALRIMEDCKMRSEKDAQLIVREAEQKAQSITQEAQDKLNEVQQEINELKGIRNHFKEGMNEIIESHLAKVN